MINQKIKNLRINGFSLNEISKKLNISRSRIQRACKNVKMSKKGEKRYHSKVTGIIKKIKPQKRLSKEKVRIMSNLLFDGAVYKTNYHYHIMYVNSSKGLINQFTLDMKKVYGFKPSSFEYNETYQRIKYISKEIYNDLIKYFWTYSTSNKRCLIPTKILKSKLFKIMILRAFWENEGSVSKEGRLSADLKNLKVIKQLSKLHNEFGLKHNISRYWKNGWAYKLYLPKNKENYEKFLSLNLFSESNVTKGYNIRRKKIDVLKEYFDKKYNN